ncbi:distal tail protein Dit [Macrococcus armenti]|uniref:distal tail protein Dit n=1 Tax=Macrococcus armenti TaxID=2875764 RepID=UPI001CD29CA8|nr:distal tail protein Dit [Macrococcus armenti]UBH10590.1 phage tail family protein [Macrococcus armenti]
MHNCTLIINGVDINTLGVKIDDSFSMPMFNIEHINSISIPGRPGELYYNDKPGPIVFKIPLYFISSDEVERQQTMRKFKRLLIDWNGKSKKVTLVNSHEPDIIYDVRVSNSNELDKELHVLGEFELELTCYDGFGYLEQEESLTWGDNVIELGSYNYELGEDASQSTTTLTANKLIEIYNKGYNTKPVITIQGSGTNINLTLNNTQHIYIASLQSTDTLVIDSFNGDVLLNGSYNLEKIPKMDWLDFILVNGRNLLYVSGTSLNLSITVDYKEIFY